MSGSRSRRLLSTELPAVYEQPRLRLRSFRRVPAICRLPTVRRASRASRRSLFLHRLLLAADLIAAPARRRPDRPGLRFDSRFTRAAALAGHPRRRLDPHSPSSSASTARATCRTWASGLSEASAGAVASRSCSPGRSGASAPPPASTQRSPPPRGAGRDLLPPPASAASPAPLPAAGPTASSPLRQRTVIVGSGIVADRLADRLDRHDEYGLEMIGLVDNDATRLDSETQRLPKLGSLDQLDSVLDERRVDRVIIAFSRASHQQLLNCIRACRDHRVAVDAVPRLFELLDSAQSINQIGGLPLLSVGAPPLSRASRVGQARGSTSLTLAAAAARPPPLPDLDRDRDQDRLTRAGALPPGPCRPRRNRVPTDQVPLDVHQRRAVKERIRGGSTKPTDGVM